jgi:hypothetical protein
MVVALLPARVAALTARRAGKGRLAITVAQRPFSFLEEGKGRHERAEANARRYKKPGPDGDEDDCLGALGEQRGPLVFAHLYHGVSLVLLVLMRPVGVAHHNDGGDPHRDCVASLGFHVSPHVF